MSHLLAARHGQRAAGSDLTQRPDDARDARGTVRAHVGEGVAGAHARGQPGRRRAFI